MSVSPLPSLPDWFERLVVRSRDADGQPPFSDQSLIDARAGKRQLVAIDEVAAALVSGGELELVVDPNARGYGHGRALLETVIEQSVRQDRATLLAWAHGDHPAARALASSHGFAAARTLLQLRTAVPPRSSVPGTLSLDSFRPGTDDADWLALNARAFASHPEQGRVAQSDLDQLEREPWFSAENFLLARDGDRLIGYCWLKVEDDTGELYVVGVDPGRQGEGIGRRLVAAGLSRLADLGISTASLYVEADNGPAVKLYESFGFAQSAVDIQYRRSKLT